MKNRKGLIITTGIVVAIIAVLIILNPLNIAPSNNSTPSNNDTNNGQPPVDSNWISPGKVFVNNYSPGHSAEWTLEVHNGNNASANFSIGYRVPDFVSEGYSRPTEDVYRWIWISNKKPLIGAYQTYNVTISLGMPSTAVPPGEKWEFWIGVIDQSQTGNIQTELGQRWLITMK